MISLTESIYSAFNENNSADIIIIYFDFAKAFDKVNHDLILESDNDFQVPKIIF